MGKKKIKNPLQNIKLHEIQVYVSINEVLLKHSHFHLCVVYDYLLDTMEELRSCDRDHNGPQNLKFHERGLLLLFAISSSIPFESLMFHEGKCI